MSHRLALLVQVRVSRSATASSLPSAVHLVMPLTRQGLACMTMEADEPVDGERAGAASQEEDEDGAPHEMLGPCLRIDEELDGHDHAEQGQRRQPGGQPEHEQGRAAELEGRRHDGRDLRRKSGELVLIAEQRDRGLPSTHLLETGAEEDAGDGPPEEQLGHAQWEAPEAPRDCGDSRAQAGGANHGARGGDDGIRSHGGPFCQGESVKSVKIWSWSSFWMAAIRSKDGSTARASPAASSSVTRTAKACRR